MKEKLRIIQIIAILVVGIIVGAFAERSHVFGYANNTPIIPNGTYQTTSNGNWSRVTLDNQKFTAANKESEIVIVNHYTNRTKGRLVLTNRKSDGNSKAYYVTKASEGWHVSPIVNGKPDHNSTIIFYAK